MLVLVRYFGVLVGYYVPSDCEVWELFLYLRRILDRLINPKVTHDGAQQLKYWVAGLNELYLKLTKSNLKPKFHFMTHYPEMLLKFGPLTQIWTMRFESKHRVSKIAARTSCSKVNVCKTIALKNQLILNNIFIKDHPLSNLSCGKKSTVTRDLKEIQQKLNLTIDTLYSVPWVIIEGNRIQTNSVLTIDLCEDTFKPLFASVINVYVTPDENVILYCILFQTLDFDLHYFAYNVCKTNEKLFIKSSSLISIVPNTLTIMRDLEMFITISLLID
jgi:hypothetical protein